MEKSRGLGFSKLTDNDAITDSTDIFSGPIIDRAIQDGKTVIVRPSSDNNDGPFQFHCKPQGIDEYIQLNSIKFTAKLKFKHSNNQTAVTADQLKQTLLANIYPLTLIKSVDIKLNQERVTDSNNLNPYQTYFQILFSYNEDSARTHLTTQMFKMDTAGKFDDVTNNANAKTRSARMQTGNEFDFYVPITADLLQSDRLLFPTTEMIITLTRGKYEFGILAVPTADDKFYVQMSDPQLHVRYVTVNPKLAQQHVDAIKRGPALYPIIRTDMKSFSIPSGQSDAIFTDLFHDVIPLNIIFGMVSTKAFHGDVTKNPFNFQHFNLQEAFFRVKNQQLPVIPIRPDFTKNLYQREYYELLANTGVSNNQDFGNMITPELYVGGCFFGAIDLSGCMDNMLRQREVKAGTVDLHLSFSQDLPEGVTIIIYSSNNAVIEIYSDKKVIVSPQPSTL